MQYSRDQRDAAEELHLVQLDDELTNAAGSARRSGRANGNQRLGVEN
jgi:hypothetical protein